MFLSHPVLSPLHGYLQISGKVDQSGSMLSEDVEEKGFTLLCMAQPRSDVEVVTCNEVGARGWGFGGKKAEIDTLEAGQGAGA